MANRFQRFVLRTQRGGSIHGTSNSKIQLEREEEGIIISRSRESFFFSQNLLESSTRWRSCTPWWPEARWCWRSSAPSPATRARWPAASSRSFRRRPSPGYASLRIATSFTYSDPMASPTSVWPTTPSEVSLSSPVLLFFSSSSSCYYNCYCCVIQFSCGKNLGSTVLGVSLNSFCERSSVTSSA